MGSHLAAELQQQGWRVLALTRSPKAAETVHSWGCTAVDLHALFNDPRSIDFASIDAVFHLAGLTKTIRMQEFTVVNALLTADILKLIWQAGFRGRFIHISSLAAAGPVSGQQPRTLNQPESPVSYYGKSKLMGERVAKKWARRLPVTILRPGAIYGPRDKDFLEVLKTLQWGVSLAVGGPMCVQLTHVQDVVSACIASAESPECIGKTYFVNDSRVWDYDEAMNVMANHLGVTRVRTVRLPQGLAKGLAQTLDFASRLAGKPLTPFTKDKWREVSAGNWIADSTPLSDDSTWAPSVSLSHGMQETIAWYKDEGQLK